MSPKNQTKKSAPKSSYIDSMDDWNLNRRKFVQSLLIGGAVIQLPFLNSCDSKLENPLIKNSYFSVEDTQVLNLVLNSLFPDDGNGPNVKELNSLEYIIWNLADERDDPSQQQYLIDGVKWTNEFATENYGISFLKLTQVEQENLIEKMTKEIWGKDWLSMVLTLIMESLLMDEVYQVNKNEIGWKWLNHQPGYPRPETATKYPHFLNTL